MLIKKQFSPENLLFYLKNNTLETTKTNFMGTYYLAWKILGVVVLLFLAYTFFVVKNKKEQS